MKNRTVHVSSVYDNRDNVSETTLSPNPPSSLTDVHWCIGYRNPNWYSPTKSVRLTNLSVKAPPTIASRHEEDVTLKKWSKP